ncbi:hypothetical protein DMN91_001109 [Ooceraea biroi]|uniref:Protein ABHD18 n=1 Tax=Ooceraea biroi TaxID=2015173 RepID=A0A3L8E6D9_OOCBI|nr:hypothetical protein DMN91_001109 [Ooceraea biroi]
MPPSRLDAVYRSILLTKFFTKGWGSPQNLKRIFEFRKVIANREACYNMIPLDYPIEITKDETWSDCHVIEGQFESPFEKYLPGIMPDKTKIAYFQMVLPPKWSSHKIKPICLHLAGTGDHFFWRRRNLIAKPLLKESGIASILLENPFYGLRKPDDQKRSSLHNMASLAATNWPKPISLVPCLSWSTASPVFTEGDAFLAGQHFAKHYPASMKRVNKLRKEYNNEKTNKDNNTVAENGTNSIDNMTIIKSIITTINSAKARIKQNNKLQHQIAEEKAAAKIFPLNLIPIDSIKDPNTLKGVCLLPVPKHPLFSDNKWREHEALQFMRGIMDECTHLKNFETPVDTELIIAVCARNDAYVPRDHCMSLETIWPGAEIRYIDAGHIHYSGIYPAIFEEISCQCQLTSL